MFQNQTNVDLSFDEHAPVTVQTPRTARYTDRTSISLAFDPSEPVSTPSRTRITPSSKPQNTLQLAHSDVPTEDDLNAPHATKRQFKHANASVGLGSDASQQILNQYSTNDVEIDFDALTRISAAIYGYSQRLRHTFQEWNKSQSSTLSKEAFKAGLQSLHVECNDDQIDALYRRFDADLDGQLTYSEFVRMLATKE